jgi:RNA polymerase sigma-70 factor, ECF subfamily
LKDFLNAYAISPRSEVLVMAVLIPRAWFHHIAQSLPVAWRPRPWALAKALQPDQEGLLQPALSSSALPMSELDFFEGLFQRYEAALVGFLWRMSHDEQAAHDLGQETFLRAWENRATLMSHPNPKAWLFRVATNLALNHARHHTIVRQTLTPIIDDVALPETQDPASAITERDQVWEVLSELPPRSRALLILREVYQFSGTEAAAMLGMSSVAAKATLVRSRRQFRQSYLRKEQES